MMIIDTHSHYNLDPLYGEAGSEWQKHWAAAQAHGVTHSVIVGTNLTTSLQAVELAHTEPHFGASVGFHPHSIAEVMEAGEVTDKAAIDIWITNLEELLKKEKTSQQVVAIGEIGLDYFRLDTTQSAGQEEAELQHYLFQKQLELADRYLLPVILHVRDRSTAAYDQTLALLQKHKKSNLPFILHCASGSTEYIKKAVEMGGYVGIAGNVTYKNADAIREIVKATPADRLLLETDAPFLPPHPHRGKTCEPWMIELTAQYLQEHCSVSMEQVYKNTQHVFTTLIHA